MGTYRVASSCRTTIGKIRAFKLAGSADADPMISRRDAIPMDRTAYTRKSSSKLTAVLALAAGIAGIGVDAAQHAALADEIAGINARIVAVGIPGASALAQVGTFLNVAPPKACANPIPSKFPSFIVAGAVLDPKRILVGSRSNYGAPLAPGAGQEGAFLSIDRAGLRC